MAARVAALSSDPDRGHHVTAVPVSGHRGEIANALAGYPYGTDPDLIECDFGEWEGLTFAEVRDAWSDALAEWLASPAVAPPGGESFDAVGPSGSTGCWPGCATE